MMPTSKLEVRPTYYFINRNVHMKNRVCIAFHKNGNKSKIISHKRKTFIQCQICLVTVNYFSKDLNMIFPLELYRMKLAKNII